MSLKNLLHSSGVRFFVFQSKDMVFYPELQAAYPASLLTNVVGMDSSKVHITSVYPFLAHFRNACGIAEVCEQQDIVIFLENFYHSSVYANKELFVMLTHLKNKRVYIHTLKTNEEECYKLMRDYPCIQLIMRTDIEYVIKEELINNTKIENIPNITYRDENNVPHNTVKESVTYCLDFLTPAYTNGVAYRDKDSIEHILDKCPPDDCYADWLRHVPKSAMLTTGRGCKYKCAYCYRGVKFSTVRTIPLDVVEADMQYLVQQGVEHIYFYDDCFLTTNKDRIDDVVALMKKYPFKYYIATRHEMCSDSVVSKLKGIDFYFVQIGLQSLKHIPNMRRGVNVDKFSDVIQQLKNIGAEVSIDTILGMPEDTPETFKHTIDYAVSLEPSTIVVNTLFVNPNTVLYDTYTDYGIQLRNVTLNVPYMVSSNTFTAEDMDDCRRYVYNYSTKDTNEIYFVIR